MKLVIYDTFNEYISSGSNRRDDLCFIKEMGSWYQGGHVKERTSQNTPKPPMPCGCPRPKTGPAVPPPMDCPPEGPSCGPRPCPPPLSVVTIDGVKYWTWDGRLLIDCDGEFIPVYGGPSNTMTKNEIREYIASLLEDYATKAYVLALLENYATKEYVDSLIHGGGGDDPQPPTPTTYSITYNLSNCRSSNTSSSIQAGSSYTTTITTNTDYTLQSVSYTMGGTSYSVSGNTISISSVTGNIVITATATYSGGQPVETFTWYAGFSESTTRGANVVTMTSSGSTISGTADFSTPGLTHYFYVWVPVSANATVPSTCQITAIDGVSSGLTDLWDLRFLGVENGYNIYEAYAHDDTIRMRQDPSTLTIKF